MNVCVLVTPKFVAAVAIFIGYAIMLAVLISLCCTLARIFQNHTTTTNLVALTNAIFIISTLTPSPSPPPAFPPLPEQSTAQTLCGIFPSRRLDYLPGCHIAYWLGKFHCGQSGESFSVLDWWNTNWSQIERATNKDSKESDTIPAHVKFQRLHIAANAGWLLSVLPKVFWLASTLFWP